MEVSIINEYVSMHVCMMMHPRQPNSTVKNNYSNCRFLQERSHFAVLRKALRVFLLLLARILVDLLLLLVLLSQHLLLLLLRHPRGHDQAVNEVLRLLRLGAGRGARNDIWSAGNDRWRGAGPAPAHAGRHAHSENEEDEEEPNGHPQAVVPGGMTGVAGALDLGRAGDRLQ